MRDIVDLPHDLFLLVISYLPPRTCVLSRSVSRRWHAAFTDDHNSYLLMRWNFPICREMRLASAAALLPSALASASDFANINDNLAVEIACTSRHLPPWSETFALVARRYHHLGRGSARVVEKLQMARPSRESDEPSPFSFKGVAPWNRFLRLEEKTAEFHYPDPAWWYSQEDGVLVYPAEIRDRPNTPSSSSDPAHGYVYHIFDPATGTEFPVPFDVRRKHIRRVRLAKGVLIFEWAEEHPYLQLNDREILHRHFVTAFDVIRTPSPSAWTWTIQFRSEWKLHYLGLPMNRPYRFFSAHTASHYAVYFWQPNRSRHQDDPIEQLAVWDISSPSPYRPSEDPTGHNRPPVGNRATSMPAGLWNGTGIHSTTTTTTSTTARQPRKRASPEPEPTPTPTGPQVIRRMTWHELDFYGLRQRANPQLRNLSLDDGNLYFIEEEHRWAEGQHSSPSPPRVHRVKCTGIPIVPCSPAVPIPLVTKEESGPATPSHAQCYQALFTSTITDPVYGPVWMDQCGADGDVNMSFCQRAHSASLTSFPSSPSPASTSSLFPTPHDQDRDRGHYQSHDQSQGQDQHLPPSPPLSPSSTRFPLTIPSNQKALLHHLRSRPPSPSQPYFSPQPSPTYATRRNRQSLDDLLAPSNQQRFPGLAPCWRHEDFPYLTVAQMVDFAAGVRITARHCFMLETVSVCVRNTCIAIKPGPAVTPRRPLASGEEGHHSRRPPTPSSEDGKKETGRSEEVQFADDMWNQLVGRKGYLAGDERWVLGEDEEGRVTIVRF
ncbi:hypothetical protein QBC32DRAFT_4266 [Pseudoneurospora amorphoporcata]|uniref:F-box domain-containing protein n=1 Tax=Pseudoneurospora amorphoporcata TaxID=241081 RepID=A0AAN6NS15_9PEZI|nr:hypothetical protein QBC32DRAFT_4266 [Pseudoneurospora amorphoporcata]